MTRNHLLKSILLLPAGTLAMKLKDFHKEASGFSASQKMPVLFIGHGNPMNAIYDNDFTRSLNDLGKRLEKPNAILVVSAHWLTMGETSVAISPRCFTRLASLIKTRRCGILSREFKTAASA